MYLDIQKEMNNFKAGSMNIQMFLHTGFNLLTRQYLVKTVACFEYFITCLLTFIETQYLQGSSWKNVIIKLFYVMLHIFLEIDSEKLRLYKS